MSKLNEQYAHILTDVESLSSFVTTLIPLNILT